MLVKMPQLQINLEKVYQKCENYSAFPKTQQSYNSYIATKFTWKSIIDLAVIA